MLAPMNARTSPLVLSVISSLLASSLLASALLACGSRSSPPKAPPPAGQRGVYVADLNRSIAPCTDFFEFANGTWRAENPIPASMPRWSRRWQSGENAKQRLKEILDEVSARRDWPTASVEQLIGDFYGGCMDQAAIEARGVEPVRPLLAEIEAISTVAGVGEGIGRLQAAGVNAPFRSFAFSNLHEPTQVISVVAAGGLGLPDRDYYVKTEPRFVESRARYLEHVAAVFRLAGEPELSARRSAERVMALELALAQKSLDNVALRDATNLDHLMSVAQLQQLTPRFDWGAYFRGAGVTSPSVNVAEPAFFVELDRQLTATPLADWKAYLRWHVLRDASPSLSTPFVAAHFSFYEAFLEGTQEMKPRWKRCVEDTDGFLGEALGKKYTDKYFPPEAKARMQLLVKNLLAAMRDTVESLEWMSAETKQRAFEKIATFNPKIGYPDKWKDYSSIPVMRDRYWESMWAARLWNVADDRSTIGKPVDRGRWSMTPPTSDAYYNPTLNEIVFPAGILQPPAFSLDAVDAINYGAIGVVIGHEISHGFDDQGAKFDASGRLKNWWTAEDLKQFQDRGQCIVDQYSSYLVEPNLPHNGNLVLGESIGDSGGANLAYRAFQKAKAQRPQPDLDGFTPDQQFFIAWGQFRGDALRPETQRLMVQGDPHPIGKYRVIGPLSHMPEFHQAFGCKAGDAMVVAAEQRCKVW